MMLVANPIMSWMIGSGKGKFDEMARLDFRGRKSGKEYKVVAALQPVDGQKAVLSNSGWRWNFEGSHPVTVIVAGEPHQMIGKLETDPNTVASVYLKRVDDLGLEMAHRRLGVKINVDRAPTHEELKDLAEKEGLSVIFLNE